MRTPELMSTPAALVIDGSFNLGSFDQPFDVVNPLDADLRALVPLPKRVKNLLLKEWQHFALCNQRFYISAVIFDSKRICLAHLVVYDRQTGKQTIHETKAPPWAARIPNALWDDRATFSSRNLTLAFHNHLDQGCHRLEMRAARTADAPEVTASVVCHENLSEIEPIVVCLPLGAGRAMYSHKALLPLDGELVIDGQRHELSTADSYALVDIHKGYYPYVMKWHWATGGGHDESGRLIGFNFTNNQVRDQARYNENCLWVGGARHLLPPVRFTLPDHGAWHVRDAHGRVDLRFDPEVERRVDLDLGLMCSRYRGPCGHFAGTIRDTAGAPISVDGCFGMGEDFYLRA